MPRSPLKVLTFNHHESYLWALAKTGHSFDLVEKVGALDLSWNQNARPRPSNMRPVAFDEEVKERLRSGEYDVVIAHTLKNLVWLFPFRKTHYIFVAHIPLFFHSLGLTLKAIAKKVILVLFRWSHNLRFMAGSPIKMRMWGERGFVSSLTPAATPALLPGCGYERVLVVCNQLKARGDELGFSIIDRLARDLPITVLGNNPGLSYAQRPRDFADFQALLTTGRIYLYAINQPWGEGYNLGLLEAMAMGMATVTVANPSSPIVDGVNGLVGADVESLRTHLKTLLADRSLVDRLGAAAQRTVAADFSMEAFIGNWNACFDDIAAEASF